MGGWWDGDGGFMDGWVEMEEMEMEVMDVIEMMKMSGWMDRMHKGWWMDSCPWGRYSRDPL